MRTNVFLFKCVCRGKTLELSSHVSPDSSLLPPSIKDRRLNLLDASFSEKTGVLRVVGFFFFYLKQLKVKTQEEHKEVRSVSAHHVFAQRRAWLKTGVRRCSQGGSCTFPSSLTWGHELKKTDWTLLSYRQPRAQKNGGKQTGSQDKRTNKHAENILWRRREDQTWHLFFITKFIVCVGRLLQH